jgi:predicted ATPase
MAAECEIIAAAGEELGQAFPLLPLLHAFAFQPPSADTAAAESLLDLIDQLSAKSPVLLVVDDLHWADEATVSMC